MDCRVKPGSDDAVDNWGTGRADNGHSDRYINPPGTSGLLAFELESEHDGIDTIKQRP
jgi:hypothetical protein